MVGVAGVGLTVTGNEGLMYNLQQLQVLNNHRLLWQNMFVQLHLVAFHLTAIDYLLPA
jgi:hypothetical protein